MSKEILEISKESLDMSMNLLNISMTFRHFTKLEGDSVGI